MNKKSEWLFFRGSDEPTKIEFQHEDIKLKIRKTEFDEVVILVFDLAGSVLFLVRQQNDEDEYLGVARPLIKEADGYEVSDSEKHHWMTAEEKEKMYDLLRKAISYRHRPLPKNYKPVWDKAMDIVQELKIINPGLPTN